MCEIGPTICLQENALSAKRMVKGEFVCTLAFLHLSPNSS